MGFHWKNLYNNGYPLDPNYIALGLVEGAYSLRKFGHNSAVGTTLQTLWTGSGLYAYPAAATIMKVSSGDTDDTAAGTGAQSVQIYGLDADYKEIDETVILNGQTEVNTTLSYLRVYRMIVRTAGSSGWNEGKLYVGVGAVTTGVPATIYAEIDAMYNQEFSHIHRAGRRQFPIGGEVGGVNGDTVRMSGHGDFKPLLRCNKFCDPL